MTALVSLILLAFGSLFMIAAGGLYEQGHKRSARFGGGLGAVLLFCAWVLA